MKAGKLALFILYFWCSQLLAVNLFNEEDYRALTADKNAAFPGDLLTILVVETSSAEASTDLASSKNIASEIAAKYNRQKADIHFGFTGKGKSAAKTGRNGKIKAALTVRITGYTPEGNYLVSGNQNILINDENQIIHLTGIVRKEDISPQNTVLSSRLAAAKITYSGEGAVANSQRHNFIYKIMSFMGLV